MLDTDIKKTSGLKMTTLLIPALLSIALSTIGFVFFGGPIVVWVLAAWFGIVPATWVYLIVFLEKGDEKVAETT